MTKFVSDTVNQVLVHPHQTEFGYSDGIENDLLQTLQMAQDLSTTSEELSQEIRSWPTEYHLSPERANLLRHLGFTKSDIILELGSGCGAITRYLGESGAKVTAVEGNLARARCTSERCRDLDNVRVYCSDFQLIDWGMQKYDYVLLIGVLEYAPMFFSSPDPMDACLKMALSLLKPNGKLVIAIENRLGLKYFLGASEDHEGKPYVGIEDLYHNNSVKTFGKHELTELLENAGFKSVKFQYPFPDYKLPQLILTEKALEQAAFKPEDIIRRLLPRDYHRKYNTTFSYELAWSALAKNKLIADFANSFLVIASPANIKDDQRLLGLLYSQKRKKSLQVKTRFTQNMKGITVEKSLMYPDHDQPKTNIQLRLGVAKYVSGDHVGHLLYKAYLQEETATFIRLLTLWLRYLSRKGLQGSKQRLGNSVMKPSYYDCIPDNLILAGNTVVYIDNEWQYTQNYTFKIQVIRGLYQFQNHHALSKPFFTSTVTLPNYIVTTLSKFEVVIDDTDFQNFLKTEAQFYDHVYGESWKQKNISILNIIKRLLFGKVKNEQN